MKTLLIYLNLYAPHAREPPGPDFHVVSSLSRVGGEKEEKKDRTIIVVVDYRWR